MSLSCFSVSKAHCFGVLDPNAASFTSTSTAPDPPRICAMDGTNYTSQVNACVFVELTGLFALRPACYMLGTD
jgi:hypothetical protein